MSKPNNYVTAYCWASGEIKFVPAGEHVPDGAVVFAKGGKNKLCTRILACARHGYKPGVLLVPGVPEAKDQSAAMDALIAWTRWAFPEHYAGGDHA